MNNLKNGLLESNITIDKDMGFLDFILGRKKEAKPSLVQSKKTEPNTQSQASKPLMNLHSAQKNAELSIFPFVFESNQHQRYENGTPVYGLQECPRTIKVEKNFNGYPGYQLKAGDGYIVQMINGDTGQPQMAAKPMRIIKSSSSEIVLRGYMVSAQTSFGYQDVDMSDYGLTIYLEESTVVKCVLHMYDRHVDIEYQKEITQCNPQVNRFEKMIQQATFNPFNITIDPRLQAQIPMPNYIDVFRKELQSSFDMSCSVGMPALDVFKGYIFNLVESYYNNAGYVPTNALDKIIDQTYKAAMQTTYSTSIPSLDVVKYQMYYAFLNN